jgi:hypothetical protein
MWERPGKTTDGQVWRDITADDAFDDEGRQEGKRRRKRYALAKAVIAQYSVTHFSTVMTSGGCA